MWLPSPASVEKALFRHLCWLQTCSQQAHGFGLTAALHSYSVGHFNLAFEPGMSFWSSVVVFYLPYVFGAGPLYQSVNSMGAFDGGSP